MAEEGVRDFGEQRGADGKLLGSELINVGVGIAEVCGFGADVGDLDGEVRSDFALDSEVPLLDVAGTEVTVDGENALAETGVGSQADGLNRWTVGKHESRSDVVLRGLRGGLHEGKLRIGKGRSDASLVEVSETEAAAYDGPFREEIGNAEARAEVAPVENS